MMALDPILEAMRAGAFVLIDLERGNRRVVAEFFEIEGPEEKNPGTVFADIGWCAPLRSSHPFHIVRGEAREYADGVWSVGDRARIEVMDRSDALMDEATASRRLAAGMTHSARENARFFASHEFGLKLR